MLSDDQGVKRVGFHCPGCGHGHEIPVTLGKQTERTWQWNGSMEKPTFHPSISVNRGKANPTAPICHSWVKDGRIQFLNDCDHHLKGQTVDLPEWE
jgi:Family of unknown function (DUF6527)